MIEVDTTYSWQRLSGDDGQESRASVPVSSTNNIHADTGVSMPVSASFVFDKRLLPSISAQADFIGSSYSLQNCQ